jgi:hypothetical protein
VPTPTPRSTRFARQGLLHFLPQAVVDDRLVLARVGLVVMHDLAAIDAVLQHVIERSPRYRLATVRLGIRRYATLANNACCIKVLLE